MSTKVAIVIPVYREINELEKISLAQCRKVLGRYPFVFVAPAGQNFAYFKPGDMIAHFPAEYFQSRCTYSNLLMTPQFYEPFAGFDYILIYQLDAFVFYDALEEFCALGYDYIGAPWPRHSWSNLHDPKVPRVGNGGFSLRNVRAFRNLLIQVADSVNAYKRSTYPVEDAFFAFCGLARDTYFNVAPVEVANLFSMEWYPARHVKRFGLPFGCHNWHRFGADFYVELFARFGWDLRPLRDKMSYEDPQRQLLGGFINVAMYRLARAAKQGQPISHHLPTKRFASIRVIRSPDAMEILSRLLTEENSLSDEIFLYDESVWTNLLRDVTPEDLPNLLIVADYDVSLIKALERGGLRYGEHIISLQREYLKYCAQLLRTFGRRT